MHTPFSLNEKNIIITGASSGIGRQCAISCSQMGANVVLISRDEERLKLTYTRLGGANHLYFPLDVTEYDNIELTISESVSRLGKIHGFIHSAGIEMTLLLKSMKPEYYNKLFSVNVISAFNLARIISKDKYIGEQASFVFISSIMGLVANAGLTGYCASKGALNSGIKSMAIELSNKNIRVNTISPGYIQTEMMKKAENNMSEEEIISLRKDFLLGLGNPDDVANACIYLLSEASKWITGTSLIVDGGYSAR